MSSMNPNYKFVKNTFPRWSQFYSNFAWLDVSIKRHLAASILISSCWFGLDYAFFISFQLYLSKLGILSQDSALFQSFHDSPAIVFLAIVLFTGFFRSLFAALRNHISNVIYQAFLRTYRHQIFRASLLNFRKIATFESLALFNETIFQAGGYWQNFSIVAANVILVALLISYSILYFGQNFLYCLALTAVVYTLVAFLLRRCSLETDQVVKQSHALSKFLVESLKNSIFIAIFKLQTAFNDKASQKLMGYEKLYKKFSFFQSIRLATPQLVGVFVILGFCHWKVITGEMKSYDFLGFFYVFFRIAQTLGEILSAGYLCQMNLESSVKIQHRLIAKFENLDRIIASNHLEKAPEFHYNSQPSLTLSEVGYSYGSKNIFSRISLDLAAGDILGITGPSGAGKSTLVAAMLGLNEDYVGEIKINNVEIRKIPHVYSQMIGYVGPTNFFIVDTIRNNLLLGHPKPDLVSDQLIIDYLKKLGLYERIVEHDGLEKILDESVDLSTGQQQRLAILRALLRKPKVLFLDEATANLDSEAEDNVTEILKFISAEIISVIVSHKGKILGLATKTIELGRY